MTVPEENRPKTHDTDEVVERRDQSGTGEETRDRGAGATGRTLREALEEAEVRPDDFDGR